MPVSERLSVQHSSANHRRLPPAQVQIIRVPAFGSEREALSPFQKVDNNGFKRLFQDKWVLTGFQRPWDPPGFSRPHHSFLFHRKWYSYKKAWER